MVCAPPPFVTEAALTQTTVRNEPSGAVIVTLIGSPTVSILPLMLAGQICPTGGVAAAEVATTVPTTPAKTAMSANGAMNFGILSITLLPNYWLGQRHG